VYFEHFSLVSTSSGLRFKTEGIDWFSPKRGF
jgi:hypothetical protein